MRVLTLNVQGFREGTDRVVSVIRATDPDVVTLNEAFRGATKRLAKETGRVAVFGVTVVLRGFGNAILLRDPPRLKRRFLFHHTRGFQRRGAVAATTHDGVTFVAVHLGLDREERVRHAIHLVDALQLFPAVVLGGDLNEGPNRPAVQFVAASYRDAFGEAGEGSGETFPAAEPRYRIDYVFCSRKLTPVRAAVVPIVASDHLAVVAELSDPQP